MDRKQKQKGKGKSKVPASRTSSAASSLPATPISIKSTTRTTSTTTVAHPALLTSPSLLSTSMRSSSSHEVFDFDGPRSAHSVPVIVSTSGQGFQWNREVFLKDEYFYYASQQQQHRSHASDERIVTHEIHLDEDELMFD